MTERQPLGPLEMWGGIECTVNRVGDIWFDQMSRGGHDTRSSDLAKFAELGIKAIRYPILWERLAPTRAGGIDWRWTDERLACLADLDVRPIVGLVHHGSGPAYTSLLDEQFPEQLAAFAGAVARRYPWVKDFNPINEPLTTARFSGLYGHWYPHHRSDRSYVRALLNQLRATVRAMQTIRETIPDARLIQTEDCGHTFGTAAIQPQVEHESARQRLTWDLLTGRVDDRHPLHAFLTGAGMTAADEDFFLEARCPPDIVGLNYYLTSDRYLDQRIDRYPSETHATNGVMHYADVEAVRARAEGIGGHLGHLLSAWHRYGLPVALTEVHLACTREEQMRWLWESWRAAEAARAQGVDVRGVTAWALLGSYDWDSLVTTDAGHYEPGVFDLRAPSPRPTALATIVRQLASQQTPTHPTLNTPGWWHRPERLLFGPTPASVPANDARPILILGAQGRLGRAFQRVCGWRGVAARALSRHECDITDPSSVDTALRRFSPWMVVNATGWTRVDDAERAPDACHATNVGGLLTVAAACRRRGIALVTFSSHLVFDGRKTNPYLEDDPTCPLNAYGWSKAEADRRMNADFPEVLIVRTGALFGPWDDSNFATSILDRLDRGQRFVAADEWFTPAYVPDLVHATLDLAMDGERGLWHLANQGATSWHAFAGRLADINGHRSDLIANATAADAGAAARPAWSVLGSLRGALLRPLDQAIDDFMQIRATQVRSGRTACVSP